MKNYMNNQEIIQLETLGYVVIPKIKHYSEVSKYLDIELEKEKSKEKQKELVL